MIHFVVDHEPVPQARQKGRVVTSKKTGTPTVMNYLERTHPVHAFKDAIHHAAAPSVLWLMANGGMLTGPIVMRLVFVINRPGRLKKGGGRVPHDVRPDTDNFAKTVMDALSGRIYVDDKQICQLSVEKWYAGAGERPHVEVTVCDWEGPPDRGLKVCA